MYAADLCTGSAVALLQEAWLDPSTTLPGLNKSRDTDAALAASAQVEADLWASTTW